MMMCQTSNGKFKQHCNGLIIFLLFFFTRLTLTDSAFVKSLSDNDIIVWGGDVRDQEAWGGKFCHTV